MTTNSTDIKRATLTAAAVAWQPPAPEMGVGVRAACQSPSSFRHNGGGLSQGYSIRPEGFGLNDRRQFQI
ncbi:MAG TPA: hypothetical protein VFA21_07700 [Pyrinomonadaceae bacterium]|nr:hypothetical protein [Pyrinomonadaceae bacterium]